MDFLNLKNDFKNILINIIFGSLCFIVEKIALVIILLISGLFVISIIIFSKVRQVLEKYGNLSPFSKMKIKYPNITPITYDLNNLENDDDDISNCSG